jgi:hypothetical protein
VFAHFTGDEPLPRWYMVNPDGTDLRSLPWFYGAGEPLDWIQPRPLGARGGAALSVPRPTRSLPVGTETLTLVDRTRRDPFARKRERRRILAPVYFPAVEGSRPRARYMPAGVANALASATVPARVLRSIATHAQLGAWARRSRYPVLAFSPGYSVPHYLYSGLLEDLASHGYVVVAIDHTRETEAVQFADGETIRADAAREPTQDPQSDPGAHRRGLRHREARVTPAPPSDDRCPRNERRTARPLSAA